MLNKCDGLKELHIPSTKRKFKSGLKYEFNSLGYRGEEFNPNAKKHIFICGCSYTFGQGINLEDTWGHQFKKILAERENIKINEVNLINFSLMAHSNDYILRTLITQSEIFKPDLIIAYFTHADRTEYVDKTGHYHICPTDDLINPDKAKSFSKNYYAYYTDELGFVNLLKNMLLLQYFCKAKKIDYILCYEEISKFSDHKFVSNIVCNHFIDLLDKEHLCSFNMEKIDKVDNWHGGKEANKLFAERIFKFYESSLLKN